MNGAEYVEYSERQTKTRTGADPRNVMAVKPKAFSFASSSTDKDPVFVYKVNHHHHHHFIINTYYSRAGPRIAMLV